VIDTNVFVSAFLNRGSTAAQAVDQALDFATVLTSRQAFAELAEVTQRPKFARRLLPDARLALLAAYSDAFEPVDVSQGVTDCRDPKDNMLLELALGGHADLIVTGDKDLLCLHPWRGIAIMNPADYLHLWPR
jgi:uncharacterized protein